MHLLNDAIDETEDANTCLELKRIPSKNKDIGE